MKMHGSHPFPGSGETSPRRSKADRFAGLVSILGCLLILSPASIVMAQRLPTLPCIGNTRSAFVAGFVGGFVQAQDRRHSEVQLGQRLRGLYGDGIQVEGFRNRDWRRAGRLIARWWSETEAESRGSRCGQPPSIILYGHSWGAAAVVYLARDLELRGIPVALTVQVDSIRKRGTDDSVIPSNVVEAINFYQTRGILHGCTSIRAANPNRTTILGNIRVDYTREPSACHDYPWRDRVLFRSHTEIECDPRVWLRIQELIESRLPPPLQTGRKNHRESTSNGFGMQAALAPEVRQ